MVRALPTNVPTAMQKPNPARRMDFLRDLMLPPVGFAVH